MKTIDITTKLHEMLAEDVRKRDDYVMNQIEGLTYEERVMRLIQNVNYLYNIVHVPESKCKKLEAKFKEVGKVWSRGAHYDFKDIESSGDVDKAFDFIRLRNYEPHRGWIEDYKKIIDNGNISSRQIDSMLVDTERMIYRVKQL